MADRYWVGDSGTWDSSNTNNWSSSSAGTITASCSGTTLTTTGSPSILGATVWVDSGLGFISLGVVTGGSGNTWTVSIGGTYSSRTMYKAVVGASVPTANDTVYINSYSGSNGTILASGTISGYSVLHEDAYGINLDLSSSTLNITRIFRIDPSANFNCGTSTINFTPPNGSYSCIDCDYTSRSFNNITVTFAANSTFFVYKAPITAGNITMSTSFSGAGTCYACIYNTTVSSTFSATGGAANQRIQIMPNAFGLKTATITAATVNISNVDFGSIVGAGAGTWSGTNIGVSGSCSGITGATPKTVYWNNPSTSSDWNFFGDYWATSSGGSVNSANCPLPQDTCIFDNIGAASGQNILINSSSYVLYTNNPNCILPIIDASSLTEYIYLKSTIYADVYCYVTTSLNFGNYFVRNDFVTYNTITFQIPTTGTFTFTSSTSSSNYLKGVGVSANTSTINSPINISGRLYSFTGYRQTVNLSGNLFCENTLSITNTTVNLNSYNAETKITLNVSSITCNASGGWVIFNTSGGSGSITGDGDSGMPLRITSSAYTVSVNGTIDVGDLEIYGKTNGANSFWCYGDIYVDSGATVSNPLRVIAPSGGSSTVTLNSTINASLTFGSGATGTFNISSNIVLGSSYALSINSGNFNANTYNITAGSVAFAAGAASYTNTVNMGTGTWTVNGGGFTATASAYLTVNRQTSTINMSYASAKTFAGGGYTYGALNQGGAGKLTITGSNRFANMTVSSRPSTIEFTAGTTQTCDAFNVSGTAGNLVTLQSTTTSAFTLTSNSGVTTNVDYLSISYSNATGGNWFAGNNSTDGGNNSGWVFKAASVGGLFLLF